MNRTLFAVAAAACLTFAPFATTEADAAGPIRSLFTRLNKPVVPGLPTLPGLPTASPLGLIAPRLSNLATIPTVGGFNTQAGRLAGLGLVAPRVSPIVGLLGGAAKTRPQKVLYGLTILSPRAAVLVGMLQAARTAGTGALAGTAAAL
jgi:hypothetical protein